MIRFEDDGGTRSERRLLSALMREPACVRHVRHVKPADFSHGIHGELFRAIVAVIAAGEVVNIETVLERVRMRMHRVPDGWARYLVTVICSEGVPANVDIYAAMIAMHHRLWGRPA